MNDLEKAQTAMGLEAAFRDSLHTAVTIITEDPAEQMALATAVLTLLLRRLHRDQGRPALEAIVTAVLQP